jgi:Lon protease-like protein
MMTTDAIELPLFPLDVVLFPGMVLPLHIFEPRYRLMVAECIRQGKPFGVVLVRPESEPLKEEPYLVGTMAEIRDLDALEDGRMNIMTIGLKRFRILDQSRDKPYLSGVVQPFEDTVEPEQELIPFAMQARELFSSYLELFLDAEDEKDVLTNLPIDPEDLSHFIAYILDVQHEQKQHFLELTSTLQRLQEEVAILQREIPFMRQILSPRISPDQSMLN